MTDHARAALGACYRATSSSRITTAAVLKIVAVLGISWAMPHAALAQDQGGGWPGAPAAQKGPLEVQSETLSFAAPVTYPACPPFTGGAAIADLNQDGVRDVVVACNASNTIAVLLGNEDGTLKPAVLVTVGNGPYSVAAADFNRDGKIDLAVANEFDNTISILLGNGDGTFQPPVNIPTGGQPSFVLVGDWNGDHKLDLAVSNYADGTIGIYTGKGDGTFRLPLLTSVPGPNQLVGADIDKDGREDIVVLNDIPEQLSDVTILLGKGNGTFQSVDVGQNFGDRPETVAVADLNKDGKLDLVVGSEFGQSVSVALGNGDGTFQPLTPYPIPDYADSVVVADFNRDGRLDIAVAMYPAFQVGVLLGNGDGTFQSVVPFPCGGQPNFLTEAFLDHNLKRDLVASNYAQGTISVLLNTSK